MKKKWLLFALLAGMCVFCLLSCRSRAEFSAGEALSVEDTQALLASLQEKTGDEEVQQEKVYYYVAGSGSVYHSDVSCGHLKNSQNVQTGTLSQLLAAGKERLCASCAKKESGAAVMGDVDGERLCYYTSGGTVWHYNKACASLSHSKNVQEGTVTQAMLEGKARPCTRCSGE